MIFGVQSAHVVELVIDCIFCFPLSRLHVFLKMHSVNKVNVHSDGP